NGVVVRDSLLENLPEYLTWDGEVEVSDGFDATGDLVDGDFTILQVPAGSSLEITYSVTLADSIPSEVEEVLNVVTDNGSDPKDPIDPETPEVICPEGNEDCDSTITPIQPEVVTPIDPKQGDTVITKSVSEEFADGYASPNETLEYTITVTNEGLTVANGVVVRDSLLENLPEYLTWDGEVEVSDGFDTTGDLADGDFTILQVPAGSSLEITYSVTLAGSIPSEVEEVLNVVTDNGSDPKDPIDPETPEVICPEGNDDCDSTITPIQPEVVTPIDPQEGDTVITKSVSEEFADGYANPGETLEYTINVTNNTEYGVTDVVVRDSLLETTPDYLTYNGDVQVRPLLTSTNGSLVDGDFTIAEIASGDTVTITYSVTLADTIPSEVEEVLNVVTDNGSDPKDPIDPETPEIICPEGNDDCDSTITPIQPEVVTPIDPQEGDTVITKSVSQEFTDGYANAGETLTYTIEVENNTDYGVTNVVVRDSLLETTPEYITFNEDVTVADGYDTTGSLVDGDFTIASIAAGETVTITYSVTLADTIPSEVEEVLNVVTDNGENPDSCPIPMGTKEVINEDCASTITPIQPEVVTPIDPSQGDTVITKSVSEEIADGYAEAGETLTYTVKVENNTEEGVTDVVVRDSMLEATPEYVTFNDDVTTDPSDIEVSGDLTTGDYTIAAIAAGDTVTITYSVTLADELPEDISELQNVVTDNNEDPNTIDVCDPDSGDCDLVIIPVEGDTVISKSVVDANENGIIEANESLEYTLELSNTGINDAHDVIVRDRMLENIPSWLTFN
ncbi:MAG: hypothetical protein ACK5LG_19870, partial [Bacteroides thetaiotaomicron]